MTKTSLKYKIMKTNNKDRLKELIEDYAESLSELENRVINGITIGIIATQKECNFHKRELNTFLDSMYIVDRRKDS